MSTGRIGRPLGDQMQAIGLQAQDQAIAGAQPEQLTQPGRNHQLTLGGEGKKSIHESDHRPAY